MPFFDHHPFVKQTENLSFKETSASPPPYLLDVGKQSGKIIQYCVGGRERENF